MYNYFVPGAPCNVTENIHATLGIANGTSCIQHSLTFDTVESEEYVDSLLKNAIPGTFVDIDNPNHYPLYVNCDFATEHSSQYDVSRWPEEFTIIKGKIIVPIRFEKYACTKIPIGIDHATKKNRSLVYKGIALSLAFAITYHKLQGKTLPKLILDINSYNGVFLALNFYMFYVGSTRVRSCNDLRFFPILPGKSMSHLLAAGFRVSENLVYWLTRYNKITGIWLNTQTNNELVNHSFMNAAQKNKAAAPTKTKASKSKKNAYNCRKYCVVADCVCFVCETKVKFTDKKSKQLIYACKLCSNVLYCSKDCSLSSDAVQHGLSCDALAHMKKNIIQPIGYRRYIPILNNDENDLLIDYQRIDEVFNRLKLKVIDNGDKQSCSFFEAIIATIKANNEAQLYISILPILESSILRAKVADFMINNMNRKYRPYNKWSFNVFYEATKIGTSHSKLTYKEFIKEQRDQTKHVDEMIIQGTARFLNRTISCYFSHWNDWLDFAPLQLNDSMPTLCIGNVGSRHFVGSSLISKSTASSSSSSKIKTMIKKTFVREDVEQGSTSHGSLSSSSSSLNQMTKLKYQKNDIQPKQKDKVAKITDKTRR